MYQPIDLATLPMREEISALNTIHRVARALSREDLEVLEAAKLIQLRRIADALENLAAPPKPVAPSHDDADQWDYEDFDPSDDPQ